MSVSLPSVPAVSTGRISPRYPGMLFHLDGFSAVRHVESFLCQAAFGGDFPPAATNLWGDTIQRLHSVPSCEGFALAGGRVVGFAAGPDLIRHKEAVHSIAGKRLPVVFHTAARAIASQGFNAQCGHDDIMGLADAGWGILFARNVQEAADLAIIARRAAEQSETPFLAVQDFWLTTHTVESLLVPEPELMQVFVQAPAERLKNLFNPWRPVLSGPVQSADSYMGGRIAQRFFCDRVKPALEAAMQEFETLSGREYRMVRPYRMDDAEFAIVGLGSFLQTAEPVVDYLRNRGMAIGAVSLTCFRPFPARELAEILGRCRAVTVIERADVPLAGMNPLSAEVRAALPNPPEVYTGVAGIGGRDVRPAHLIAAARNMREGEWRSFVLGVKHPEALDPEEDPDPRPEGAFSIRGLSVGGYPTASPGKAIVEAAAALFGVHVQAWNECMPERRGLPVRYSVTLAPEPIRMHSELKTFEALIADDVRLLSGPDALDGLAPEGAILLQTDEPAESVWATLAAAVRKRIRLNRYRLYVNPYAQLAALIGAILRLAPFQAKEGDMFDRLFATLGADTEIARRAYDQLAQVTPPEGDPAEAASSVRAWHAPISPADGKLVATAFCDRVVGGYNRGRTDELAADAHAARSLVPPSTTRHRSFRHLAPEIPLFEPGACTGCMECVNVCPDTAIVGRVAEPSALVAELLKIEKTELRDQLSRQFAITQKYHGAFVEKGDTGGLFGIFIDADKCKGCGECVTVCGPPQALRMAPKQTVDLGMYDLALDLFHHLPETPARFINEKSLGDMMLANRALLYAGGAGSCAGCAESTAIRMMLAATGFVYGHDQVGVVATTGCNAESGGTYPYNPYAVPWTNAMDRESPSDAIGIRLRWNQQGYSKRRLWVIGEDIPTDDVARLIASGLDIKILQMHRGLDAQFALMYPRAYLAQTTPAHLNHFYRAVMEANAFDGPALVTCYASCRVEHGIPEDRASVQAMLAVESRIFPLFTYDPRRGERLRDCLSLQGNPALQEDWCRGYDVIAFARTEPRFARRFDSEGRPDEMLLALRHDRLTSWRRLKEMAGM